MKYGMSVFNIKKMSASDRIPLTDISIIMAGKNNLRRKKTTYLDTRQLFLMKNPPDKYKWFQTSIGDYKHKVQSYSDLKEQFLLMERIQGWARVTLDMQEQIQKKV